MGHLSCCVVNCKNTGRNSDCKFYKFPKAQWKLEQRKQWIRAVRRKNVDGTPWSPRPNDAICSEHFMGGRKSLEKMSPSYIPTIFPPSYKTRKVDESSLLKRHERFMKRRRLKENDSGVNSLSNTEYQQAQIQEEMMTFESEDIIVKLEVESTIDKECQVEIFSNAYSTQTTFICNRFVQGDVCEAEIQTEIVQAKFLRFKTQKECKSKSCGTPHKFYVDQSTEIDYRAFDDKFFSGISSIRSDAQLVNLVGVNFHNFNLLLERMNNLKHCKMSLKNRLLLFLIKMKIPVPFSVISSLFGISSITASKIFFSTLHHLAGATSDLVSEMSQDTFFVMKPDCLHPDYNDAYTHMSRVLMNLHSQTISDKNTLEKEVWYVLPD